MQKTEFGKQSDASRSVIAEEEGVGSMAATPARLKNYIERGLEKQDFLFEILPESSIDDWVRYTNMHMTDYFRENGGVDTVRNIPPNIPSTKSNVECQLFFDITLLLSSFTIGFVMKMERSGIACRLCRIAQVSQLSIPASWLTSCEVGVLFYAKVCGRPCPPVTTIEMRGMLAIHIIRGYAHVRNLKDAWKKDIDLHNEGIANIMPYYRFQQIWKFFKVVDPHRRLAAGEDKEKFWIKEFLEQLNEGLSQCFIAAGVLIADEYLSGSSHHLSILRTLLRKPNKKGSLWFLLCSSYELAIAARRGANGRRREAESAAAASTSKSSSAAPSTAEATPATAEAAPSTAEAAPSAADALPGHAEKMAAKSATGREKFVQKVYIPHIAVLYTGGEEWREREQGPRGGLGPVIAKWRGFGEGACFLVYMLTILMAKGT